MKTVEGTCPECGSPELFLYLTLVAKPIGTYSLAGVQTKFSATHAPVLECQNLPEGCNWRITGEIQDGQAVFHKT